MHKLIEYICDELEELERKAEKDGKLSMQEIQYADTLAHMKKNMLKADEMWEDSEYSEARDGRSMRGGSYRSYARGRNARRDAMGRYSRAEDDFRMDLKDLIADAPNDHVRQKLQSLMSEM